MRTIDVEALVTSMPQRFSFLAEFAGFDRSDWEAVRGSVVLLAPALPRILDELFDALLGYDDTRRAFLGAGEVSPDALEIRREHLTEWFLEAAGAVSDSDRFANYIFRIGRMHTPAAGHQGHHVPPRYVVALTSLIQTTLTEAVFAALSDEPTRARKIATAWNKLLVIQLEILLKASVPGWDEAPTA